MNNIVFTDSSSWLGILHRYSIRIMERSCTHRMINLFNLLPRPKPSVWFRFGII